ncbi:MAG TPA: hypothetical protein VJO13_10280 [Ktedonobacterales bacterium]|nr:hypothetical protein [Ktedonobacterales bacterium]
MRSKRTKEFLARFDALPESVQQQANGAYRLFAADPSHPGLDFKQVSKKGPVYSARIGIHYRVSRYEEQTTDSGSGLAVMRSMISC